MPRPLEWVLRSSRRVSSLLAGLVIDVREPPRPRPRRRVMVSAEGEVTHVQRLPPLPWPPLPSAPYPFLDGDAHPVDRRSFGIVLGTDRRVHTLEIDVDQPLLADVLTDVLVPRRGGYVGWLPDGTGHGVPPDTATALCGVVPQFLWLGEFLSDSVERVVRRCEACVALAHRHHQSSTG